MHILPPSISILLMPYTDQEKKKATARLRRICGQAKALERAVEEGTECSKLLQQIAAIRGAVNGLMSEVLESHIRETFAKQNSSSKARKVDEGVNQILTLVQSYLK